jgi:hypothetical protein
MLPSSTIPHQNNHPICPICFYPQPPGHEEFCEILILLKKANQDLVSLLQQTHSVTTPSVQTPSVTEMKK